MKACFQKYFPWVTWEVTNQSAFRARSINHYCLFASGTVKIVTSDAFRSAFDRYDVQKIGTVAILSGCVAICGRTVAKFKNLWPFRRQLWPNHGNLWPVAMLQLLCKDKLAHTLSCSGLLILF